MRISKRGQITIPKRLRDQFGLNQDAEVEITPTAQGLLIQKQTAAQHPVDRVCGILDGICDVDEYLEKIRGR
jgi:AbrB family looped-hinge helix DNA binding protein